MDKHLSKVLFRAAGVGHRRLAHGAAPRRRRRAARARFCGEVADALGLPVIVKPSKQGSSVALTVVRDRRRCGRPWTWRSATTRR
jgi:D-alanine-D-alanine ligase-like ATP-grasp enzyme